MVEGLTSSATDQGPWPGRCWDRIVRRRRQRRRDTQRSKTSMAPRGGESRRDGAAETHPDATNPGDSSGEATPVPIPNTEVKLSSAENTERAAFREDRSSPGFLRLRARTARTLRGHPAPAGRGPAQAASAMLGVMTGEPDALPASPNGSSEARPDPGARLPRGVCPLLETSGGRWRHAGPARDHRCQASRPPSALTADKQRRLCLVAAHVTCPAFVGAVVAREAWAGVDAGDQAQLGGSNRWGILRVAPVVAAPDERSVLADLLRQRAAVQAGLVGLLVIASFFIVVARPPADRSDGARLVPMATLRVTPPSTTTGPSTGASRTPSPTSAPTATPRPSVSAVPSPTTLTYTVVAGDTLTGIAARFGTTVKAIMDLNALTTTTLRIGQQLLIPPAAGTSAPSLVPAP